MLTCVTAIVMGIQGIAVSGCIVFLFPCKEIYQKQNNMSTMATCDADVTIVTMVTECCHLAGVWGVNPMQCCPLGVVV